MHMDMDEVFDHIGHFGLYQILLFIILGMNSLIASVQNISINFIAAYQDHWCHVPRLENFSHQVQKYVAIPYDNDKYDSCHAYAYNFDNLSDSEILSWNRSLLENASIVDCNDWVYDQSEFSTTINSEFNLVCGRSWLSQLISTIFMAGMLVGGLTSGVVSDLIGRYKVCMIGICVNIVSSIANTFAPEYISFVCLRFLGSVSSTWIYLVGFVLVMEVMSPAYRVHLGVFFHVFFSIGFMVATGVSYSIRDFRKYQLAISVPNVAMLILFGLIPESPRWLLSKGRVDKAKKILQRIAEINGKQLPADIQLGQQASEKDKTESASSLTQDDKGKFSDICSSPILRKEICIVYFCWFTTATVYYGLSLNSASFGDVFLNTFLSGLIEIPANLLCILCLEKGGRRFYNAGALLIGGVFCLLCVPVVVINPDLQQVLTALSTIGKGAITFVFSGIYIYTAELFYTPVRHLAVGTSSTLARIGSMVSPYIGPPLADIWAPMPTLIFGVLSVATGAVCFLLPETKNHGLPNTLEEAELIGKSPKDRRLKLLDKEKNIEDAVKVENPCTLTKVDKVENAYSNGTINHLDYDNAGVVQSTAM